jgi:hypothetical protein
MAKVVANNAQTAATEVLAGLVERVTFHNLRREPTDDGKDSESSCLSDRFCKRVGTAVPRNSMHKRTFAKGSKPGMTGLLLGYARVSKADDQTNTAQRVSEKFYADTIRLRMSRVAAISIIASDVWTRNS